MKRELDDLRNSSDEEELYAGVNKQVTKPEGNEEDPLAEENELMQ
jgi:hypothetical protein